jgi:hypothetical protein
MEKIQEQPKPESLGRFDVLPSMKSLDQNQRMIADHMLSDEFLNKSDEEIIANINKWSSFMGSEKILDTVEAVRSYVEFQEKLVDHIYELLAEKSLIRFWRKRVLIWKMIMIPNLIILISRKKLKIM